ncbi:hypothetical protein [Gracilimonas sp.]|uniref:hypothetical protein n=1 Tax=Gracilimonas sp. TaxID=1974203 RepID=UPI0032EE985D
MKKIFVTLILLVLGVVLYSCESSFFGNDEASNAKVSKTDFEIGEPFNLSFGEALSNTDNSITVEFKGVTDSRCPADVNCVWEGNGKVTLVVSIDNVEYVRELNTHPDDQNSETINGITFNLIELNPYPESAEKATSKKEYVAVLIAVKE